MSDKYFSVQFRSMQSGIHSVATFTAMSQAQEFFEWLDMFDEVPTGNWQVDMSTLQDIKEIDFRNPPDIYPFGDYEKGLPLELCNVPYTTIPDVYNY